ncbi:hypothetical protein ABPG73_004064 [Tetrahymena malaccensis]
MNLFYNKINLKNYASNKQPPTLIYQNISNLLLLQKNQIYQNKIEDNKQGYKKQEALNLESTLLKCINLSNLTLNLENNQIGDDGASNLCSTLSNLTKLTVLTLDLSQSDCFIFYPICNASLLRYITSILTNIATLTRQQISEEVGFFQEQQHCLNLRSLALNLKQIEFSINLFSC